jgi:MFS transporter, SP family, general alpha glucoside:H+ symporter
MMIHTNEQEKAASEGVGYLDCFTGVDLRRTEIISCVWMIQVWCGIWFGGVSMPLVYMSFYMLQTLPSEPH